MLLTLSSYDRATMELDLKEIANAVRIGLDGAPSMLATDQQRGFVSPSTMLSWDHDETNAIRIARAVERAGWFLLGMLADRRGGPRFATPVTPGSVRYVPPRRVHDHACAPGR